MVVGEERFKKSSKVPESKIPVDQMVDLELRSFLRERAPRFLKVPSSLKAAKKY